MSVAFYLAVGRDDFRVRGSDDARALDQQRAAAKELITFVERNKK